MPVSIEYADRMIYSTLTNECPPQRFHLEQIVANGTRANLEERTRVIPTAASANPIHPPRVSGRSVGRGRSAGIEQS